MRTSSDVSETNFIREIYFTKVVDGSVAVNDRDAAGQTKNEVLVTVNVYWSNSFGASNKFSLSTRLYNWKIIAD